MTITINKQYDGKSYPIDNPPAWLLDRIGKAIPFLNPNMPHQRLVCSDTPSAVPTFGQYAPCNGGYTIDIERKGE
jgi:hypothetical protein